MGGSKNKYTKMSLADLGIDEKLRPDAAVFYPQTQCDVLLSETSYVNKILCDQYYCKLAEIKEDGNCMFRAVSDYTLGTQEHHLKFRKEVCDYMNDHIDEYFDLYCATVDASNLEPDEKRVVYADYVNDMRRPTVWGDEFTLAAMAKRFQVDITIYQAKLTGSAWYHWESKDEGGPPSNDRPQVYLVRTDNNHYSSVHPFEDQFFKGYAVEYVAARMTPA